MQILDQIKNQFPVPVFSWGYFIPSIEIVSSAPLLGVLHRQPFSPETLADVFSQKIIDCCVMAWLIMHKITFLRHCSTGCAQYRLSLRHCEPSQTARQSMRDASRISAALPLSGLLLARFADARNDAGRGLGENIL